MANIVIEENVEAGQALVRDVVRGERTHIESVMVDLLSFGFSEAMIEDWRNDPVKYGHQVGHIFMNLAGGQDRLSEGGVTRLGHYIASIRSLLHETFPGGGMILDFGCGPTVDHTAILASGGNFTAQLVDITPMCLAYSAYQLERRGIPVVRTLVSGGNELEAIPDGLAMIVESTAFEHVAHIRHLFVPLMEKLLPGGLFLTNYTRLDWTNPDFDGFPESHEYALTAADEAAKLAVRCEWSPPQEEGKGWDLWQRSSAE